MERRADDLRKHAQEHPLQFVSGVLPVDAVLPQVLDALRSGRNVVLEAPPGAGKTTRIPPALLSLTDREILALEPRRIAARLAARRVAEELGERVGQTVGYQVRFEEVAGPSTRIRFLTEGVLTRRLLSDPQLSRVGVVVLDEFHERHLDADLALALLRRLQRGPRPDLRLVVMSATIDAAPIARFLDDCPVISSQGRLHPVEIEYTPCSGASLEQQVAAAIERLVELNGHILVFLPGAAEIRRAARACEPLASRAGLTITPLHGDLPATEQDRAVLPSLRRKLILSTNVAESSITIDGVTAVIDSGLARIPIDSPWTGLPGLDIARISKASARQRAGRAGRTAPGRVIRLYTQEDYARRAEHDPPEIMRRELSQTLLDLRALGVCELQWLEPPPQAAVDAAETLLRRLGAFDSCGELTQTGRKMAALPLHPRLARLAIEAVERGVAFEGCAAAAALSSGERLESPPDRRAPSDLLVLIDREWQPNTRRTYDQIRRLLRAPAGPRRDDTAILISILTAFPDRVARRRQGREFVFAGGISATLADTSAVDGSEFLVAVDAETRRDRGLLIRLASAIEPEWLIDLFPDQITERDEVEWNRAAERVERVTALEYDGLILHESRGAAPDPDKASALLTEKALEQDISRFVDPQRWAEFRARVEYAAAQTSMPLLTDDDVRQTLRELCAGKRSFAELEREDLIAALRSRLGDLRRLDQIAPLEIRLAGGRRVKVRYAPGKPPWIASRLQDFFGMRDTPRIGGAPVVVHLLAPNHRPVQMTSDLAGFWERLYPQLRRELSRRYPKHSWPEKPV
jgi:ATP-dependent helicase HrpB